MNVRNADFTDMPRLGHIMAVSFRSAFSHIVTRETLEACANEERCAALLGRIFLEGKMHFLIGEDSGMLVWQEAEEGPEIVAIHSLPGSWGTGLGHAMLTEALRRIGDRKVSLWAFKENARARRFYEKHGFHWDGAERVSAFDGALEVRYVHHPVPVCFSRFTADDYQAVCDFLIALNEKKRHINWNWARWEWMYAHPYTNRAHLDSIGLWKVDGAVVGAAICDMYFGEAFCGALEEYEDLLPEILAYAYRDLKDESGLGIAVREENTKMQNLLSVMGYRQGEQAEQMLCRALDGEIRTELPEGWCIREISLPEDALAYQVLIWKGFDHEGDDAELESMLRHDGPLPVHRTPYLCLAVANETGELVAHCTCWYDTRTDYAYVEPVCTIPAYRGRGLGRVVVLEALNRCRLLGAKEAYVLSDQEFYKKMDFRPHSRYHFYWKKQ